jgi:hypothetical protein
MRTYAQEMSVVARPLARAENHNPFWQSMAQTTRRAANRAPSPQPTNCSNAYEPLLRAKSTLFVSPDPTVTCSVTGSSPSCHAWSVYEPGGSPLIS